MTRKEINKIMSDAMENQPMASQRTRDSYSTLQDAIEEYCSAVQEDAFLLGIYDCYETVWESRGIVMNNKLLLNDDIQNLDIIKDKMSVLLNDVELYFDNDNNRPELPCEQSCFDMEITRIRIIYDYIDWMEETINKMYDHVK